ncbi:MAG: endonuclease VIII [Pseudomonadota bacterium]
MPEGPEIRRAADRIERVLGGQVLEEVRFDRTAFPALARRQRALVGSRVLRLDTRGKALLTRLDSGLSIYSHNQLYGRWYVRARDDYPVTNRSLRLALHTAEHSALLYSASEIDLLDAAAEAEHPFLRKLGPDLLDPALTWRVLAERLAAPQFAGRTLGALYLEQGFLAGLGNYLRSEILFHAGLSPWAKPALLRRGALGTLARTTLKIGTRAYRSGGVCNPPQLYRRLKRRYREVDGGHPRGEHEAIRFAVFDRAGLPCHTCGTVVEKTAISARRLYYCPVCQREGEP